MHKMQYFPLAWQKVFLTLINLHFTSKHILKQCISAVWRSPLCSGRMICLLACAPFHRNTPMELTAEHCSTGAPHLQERIHTTTPWQTQEKHTSHSAPRHVLTPPASTEICLNYCSKSVALMWYHDFVAKVIIQSGWMIANILQNMDFK